MGQEKYEGQVQGHEFIPSGESGIMVSGRWMNKRTGAVVNVRNSVMDGDKMIIITDKGQLSMQEFSRDYVQASDEIFDESGNVVGNEPQQQMTPEQSDDWALIQETYGMNNTETFNYSAPTTESVKKESDTPNSKIIDKVFKKLKTFPEITIDIKWDDFPDAQMHTLVDYLDISIDDIAKYIKKNYMTDANISEKISELITAKNQLIKHNGKHF